MSRKLNYTLVFILIILISVISGLRLGKLEYNNNFLYFDVAFIIKSLQLGHVDLLDSVTRNHPGYEMILIVLSQITGMSPIKIIFVPIGSFVLPVIYFVLSRKILNSWLIACLLTLYIGLDGSLGTELYSVFAYVWTYTLYLLYLLVFIKTIHTQRRIEYISLLIIIFLGSLYLHYTVPIWIIIITFLYYFISKTLNIGPIRYKTIFSLNTIALFIVEYLAINKIIYGVALPSLYQRIEDSTFLEPLFLFFDKIQSYIFGTTIIVSEEYSYQSPISREFGIIRVLIYLLILSPILLNFLKYIYLYVMTRKKIINNFESLFFFLFSATLLTDMLMYSIVGVFSTKYILLMGPIMMLLSLKELKFNYNLKVIYTCLFVLLSISSLFLNSFTPNEYSNIENGAYFVAENAPQESKLLTDMSTYSYLLPTLSEKNKDVSIKFFNSSTYGYIVSKDFRHNDINCSFGESFDYIIIYKMSADKAILCERWKSYEPFSFYFHEINTNTQISKIYNDERSWIFYT